MAKKRKRGDGSLHLRKDVTVKPGGGLLECSYREKISP